MGSGSGSVKDSRAEKFGIYDLFGGNGQNGEMPKNSENLLQSSRTPAPNSVMAGHVKRSQLLNNFADLETEVTRLLDHLNIEYGNGSLGQKIKKIRDNLEHLENTKLATKLVEDASNANVQRNSVVHSKLSGTNPKEGSQGWKFSIAGRNGAKPVIHSPSDLENLGKKVRTLSNQFKQLRNLQPAPASRGASTAKSSAR